MLKEKCLGTHRENKNEIASTNKKPQVKYAEKSRKK